jgi:hypothetical protein
MDNVMQLAMSNHCCSRKNSAPIAEKFPGRSAGFC